LRVLVEDSTGAAVAGSKVTLLNSATGVLAEAESSDDGYALFSPIVRGLYEVTVAKSGFKTFKIGEVRINVDERRLLRVRLEVAQIAETVEVTANVTTIQTEQGSLGQVISGKTAVDLPLAGRRYTELALLSPGVAPSTLTPVTRGPGWFVSNGNYHTQNNFLLDGIDNNQGTTNAQALSAQVVQPNPDSIAEFKVQTNAFSAEFGRSAGGVVVKNKLFYFGSYEGFRQSFANSFLTTVPTAQQRQGIFDPATRIVDPQTGQAFPNFAIPPARFDALGKKLIDLYPEPNQPGRTVNGRPTNNYAAQRDGREDTHKFDTRADYQIGDKSQLMGRFSYLRQKINRDAIFPGLADGVGNQGLQFNNNQSLALSWTRTFGVRFVNTLRYGWNRTFAEFAHATAGAQKADAFGFRGIPPELLQVGGLPLIEVTNYNPLGTRNFRPQFQRPYLNQFIDSLSLTLGRHFIRTGFEARLKDNTFVDITRRTPAYSVTGGYTGDAIADLLLGLPDSVTLNTVPEVQQLQQAYSAFFQDDWKVLRTLTLNLGLRYEYTTPFYGNGKNKNVNFDPATGGLVFTSKDDKYLTTPDRNNFGPRLGIAWQLVPEKLVFRGGYGIFYNTEDIYGSEANLPLNPPQLIQARLQRVGTGPAPLRISDPIPSGVLSNFDSRNVALRTREREQRSGLIQQWNIALQYQLDRNSTFEAAYVGNNGRNLFGLYERNQTNFGVDGTVPANRPFPQWQGIQTGATRARSKYNALQAKFERNVTNNLFALLSYTWASALDQAGAWDAGSSPQFRDNFNQEWGRMSQTPKQLFTAATSWELPFGRGRRFGAGLSRGADLLVGGWRASGIVFWRSGLPINVSLAGTGIDPRTGQTYRFLGRNGGGLRPNRVGEANTGIDPKTDRFRFLDPAAYAVQPINTPGNAARNSAYGPRFFNTNFVLSKSFTITEGKAVDFRWEAYNLFNTVNFNNPNTTFGGTTFGQITGAGDARVMQLGVRFGF
jgi:hypothetical protein